MVGVRASGIGVPIGIPIGGATSRSAARQDRHQHADDEDEDAKQDPTGHRLSIDLLRPVRWGADLRNGTRASGITADSQQRTLRVAGFTTDGGESFRRVGRAGNGWMDLKASRLLAMAFALACLVATSLPAQADRGPWPDPRDARGPLSIRKIDIGHKRWGNTTIEVTFERPVDPAHLDERDFIVFDFDSDGDHKSEEWVYYFPVRGRWRGVAYYPRLDDYELAYYDLNRTSRRSFKLVIPPYAHQSRGGYYFRVATSSGTGSSCSKGCLDHVPNANWLIHDWTYPVIHDFQVLPFSLTTGNAPAFETRWHVTDHGFSGLHNRTLWKRAAGTEEWQRVTSNRQQRPTKDAFETEQGNKLELRVTGVDGAGNKTASEILETVVPFDDTNDSNEAVYLGAWEQLATDDAYLGSAHVSSTPLDTFRFSGTGRRYCITYRISDEFGRAALETSEQGLVIDMSSPSYMRTGCIYHSESAPRTAVLSAYDPGAIINVDAYWVD